MSTLRKAIAKEGHVWKLKNSDIVLSEVLYLGKEDSIERYEQILEPIEPQEETPKEE